MIADGGRFSAHGAASGGFAPIGADQAARRGVTLRGIEQVQFGPGEHERLAGGRWPRWRRGASAPSSGRSSRCRGPRTRTGAGDPVGGGENAAHRRVIERWDSAR